MSVGHAVVSFDFCGDTLVALLCIATGVKLSAVTAGAAGQTLTVRGLR